jgi:hypothetical protein
MKPLLTLSVLLSALMLTGCVAYPAAPGYYYGGGPYYYAPGYYSAPVVVSPVIGGFYYRH